MQEAFTLICVDQDLRRYIAWLGHNKLSPNADFRKVLGSLTRILSISWSYGYSYHATVYTKPL